jgi:hypothetical protein
MYMTYKERLNNEKDNLTKIILYDDKGLFLQAVERSAYAFHTRIKPFKVHVKTLKDFDGYYMEIGVPSGKVDTYLSGLTVNKEANGIITAILDEPIDENAFQAWKKHIIEQMNAAKIKSEALALPTDSIHEDAPEVVQSCDNIILRQCLQEVKTLNIASMTPMEAMLYLNSLQQKLKDVNI